MLTPPTDTEKVQAAGRGAHGASVSRQAKVWLRAAALGVGAFFALGAATGCGEAEGVADGATVTAYVEAPLCAEAQRELRRHDGRAGGLKLRAVCLASPPKARKLNLATVGANARRATEDSTSVAYLEAPDPRVAHFTHPILEKAEIPWVAERSGKAAMSRLIELIESAGSGSLRRQLQESLGES